MVHNVLDHREGLAKQESAMNPPDSKPLEIHDLTVAYHRKPVLYGIDLEIAEGTLTGIIGPNGAGKSTLIKTIMGMVPSNGGWIKIFGKPAKKVLCPRGLRPQRESVDWDFPGVGSRCGPNGQIRTRRVAEKDWKKGSFDCLRMS